MANAVGFYWTLPVPWAGFTQISGTVEEAAQQSRTLRYQCDLIRRYAKANDLTLVHEAVFLEFEPDRGSVQVNEALAAVAPICKNWHAKLLVVDFAAVQNWRGHQPLQDCADSLGIRLLRIFPDEIIIDGQTFDPSAHFEDWRARQQQWSASKTDRLAKALERAAQLRLAGDSLAKTAAALNAEGLLSTTGKPWTADNLRKALAAPD